MADDPKDYGFALPPSFFQRLVASSERESEWVAQNDALLRETVRSCKWAMSYEDGALGWKLSSSQKQFRDSGIRSYSRKADEKQDRRARSLEVKCMGKVSLSLHQAMQAVYADNTLDFRNNTSFLLETCLDAAVVHVIKRRTELEPFGYLGVNWLGARSPGLFAKKRDFCYLRSTGVALDNERKEVGYVLLQSVDLKECASLESSTGLVRTKISGALLFRENPGTGTTSIMWQGTMGLSGFSPNKLMAFVHDAFTSCVSNLNKYVETKYMTRQIELNGSDFLAPKGGRKNCYLCNRKFSVLRSRHHCRLCSEVICKECVIPSRVSMMEAIGDVGRPSLALKAEPTSICRKCVSVAKRNAEHESDNESPWFHKNIFTASSHGRQTSADYEFYGDRMSSTSSSGSLPGGTYPSEQAPCISTSEDSSTRRASTAASVAAAASVPLPEPSMGGYVRPTHRATLYVEEDDMSSDQVPASPVSMRVQRERRRSRLETDPLEAYDAYDAFEEEESHAPPPQQQKDKHMLFETDNNINHRHSYHAGAPSSSTTRSSFSDFSSSNNNNSNQYGAGSRTSEGDLDFASRLWEISCKAKETLDTTKRNSLMVSDTSSAPRVSELLAFQQLDKSIAEQADLLNVIGFVSTGRVYMEPDCGGVRVSESSSLSDSDRFEVLT